MGGILEQLLELGLADLMPLGEAISMDQIRLSALEDSRNTSDENLTNPLLEEHADKALLRMIGYSNKPTFAQDIVWNYGLEKEPFLYLRHSTINKGFGVEYRNLGDGEETATVHFDQEFKTKYKRDASFFISGKANTLFTIHTAKNIPQVSIYITPDFVSTTEDYQDQIGFGGEKERNDYIAWCKAFETEPRNKDPEFLARVALDFLSQRVD